MTEKPMAGKSFVSHWVESMLKAEPGSPIVQAIAEATSADVLSEAELLAALRKPAKQAARRPS